MDIVFLNTLNINYLYNLNRKIVLLIHGKRRGRKQRVGRHDVRLSKLFSVNPTTILRAE